jgi:hypothetical protein
MNTSIVDDNSTARTCFDAAMQRAENLAIIGAKRVIELCVGPSLKQLAYCYSKFNIDVTGNDIEKRWADYYPQGKWVIGDCFGVSYQNFDTIVFAPPLSVGCTGTRENSLSIDKVYPKYNDFLKHTSGLGKNIVLVLPARSLSNKYDRLQFYKLTNYISTFNSNFDVVELKSGRRMITKYVDVYIKGVKC